MMKKFWRKGLFCLMGALLAVIIAPPIATSAASATQAQAVAWAQSKINVGLDYDGAYGNQCVDLIYYYYTYLGASSMGGNACDYATNDLPSGWQRIACTDGFIPQPGDIAVWKTNHSCGTCATGWAGHVGIITSADSVGFNAVNQRPSVSETCTQDWFWLSSLQCVIRPNFASAVSVTKTVNCKWVVTIPANYKLELYYGAGDAAPTTERWINPKDAAYRLSCDQQVTVSDGSTRYRFTSGDGYTVYFKYDSSKMSVTQQHSYTTSYAAATCTTAGYNTQKCSNCGYTVTETITALGHNYSSSYTVDKAATCTAAGSQSRHCTRCSATTSVTAIAATGHSFGSWTTTKAATCTAAGSRTHTCGTCGQAQTETIAALGHNYSSSYTVDKAATCTAAGSQSRHCTRCSATTAVATIAATGHSFGDWTTTKEPTADEAGLATRRCACGTVEQLALPKLATDGHTHQYGDWTTTKEPACTADGTAQRRCTSCEATETYVLSATGHSFSDWTTAKEPTCTADGTAQRRCTSCEATETHILSATGHSYGPWSVRTEATETAEGLQERSCADCGVTETQPIAMLAPDESEIFVDEPDEPNEPESTDDEDVDAEESTDDTLQRLLPVAIGIAAAMVVIGVIVIVVIALANRKRR